MASTPDLETVKARMKSTWMAGDYGAFAKFMEPGALEILAGWQIPPGARMLDVGCGAGQIAIPAARAGVNVTGVDIAPNLISQARARASTEGVVAQFDEGDAERLPYPDAWFDVVVSLIGAMFAPRPEQVASEFLRVCRSGGRILMANWTPTGFPGNMWKIIAKYVPPPPGIPLPTLWGDEDTVRSRLREGIRSLTLTRRTYPSWRYPFNVPQVVQYFREYFGPIQGVFTKLDEEAQDSLRHELEEAFSQYNRAKDDTTLLEGEYLDVVAIRE
jgi:ubiquinone/menaquinone biosynthesis C-methylase UbiE